MIIRKFFKFVCFVISFIFIAFSLDYVYEEQELNKDEDLDKYVKIKEEKSYIDAPSKIEKREQILMTANTAGANMAAAANQENKSANAALIGASVTGAMFLISSYDTLSLMSTSHTLSKYASINETLAKYNETKIKEFQKQLKDLQEQVAKEQNPQRKAVIQQQMQQIQGKIAQAQDGINKRMAISEKYASAASEADQATMMSILNSVGTGGATALNLLNYVQLKNESNQEDASKIISPNGNNTPNPYPYNPQPYNPNNALQQPFNSASGLVNPDQPEVPTPENIPSSFAAGDNSSGSGGSELGMAGSGSNTNGLGGIATSGKSDSATEAKDSELGDLGGFGFGSGSSGSSVPGLNDFMSSKLPSLASLGKLNSFDKLLSGLLPSKSPYNNSSSNINLTKGVYKYDMDLKKILLDKFSQEIVKRVNKRTWYILKKEKKHVRK